jgi:hypothetical protein
MGERRAGRNTCEFFARRSVDPELLEVKLAIKESHSFAALAPLSHDLDSLLKGSVWSCFSKEA